MFVCAVCGADDGREELVEEVFNIEGRCFLVEGVQCMVCARCGGQSFRRETAERGRPRLRGEPRPARSVSIRVYEFSS